MNAPAARSLRPEGSKKLLPVRTLYNSMRTLSRKIVSHVGPRGNSMNSITLSKSYETLIELYALSFILLLLLLYKVNRVNRVSSWKYKGLRELYLEYRIECLELYLGRLQGLSSFTLNEKEKFNPYRNSRDCFKTDNVSATTDPLKPRQPVPTASPGPRYVERSSPSLWPPRQIQGLRRGVRRSTLAYIISQRKLRGIKAWIGGLKARISGQLAPIYRRKTYSSQLFRAITILFAGCWRGAFRIGLRNGPSSRTYFCFSFHSERGCYTVVDRCGTFARFEAIIHHYLGE